MDADHLFVRLQTDGQRLLSLREHRAERIFVFLPVMRELPILERPERKSETGRLAKDAFVTAK